MPQASIGSQAALPGSAPDFSITANPSTVDLKIETFALVNVTVTSLNGFQGRVYLNTESFPGGGLVVWFSSYIPLSLLPGQSANATLTINTQSGYTVRGEWIIWVSANASPCLNHILTIPIIRGPLPISNFTLSADPTSLTFPAGDYLHYSTVSVSSIGGFNGSISFQYLGGVLYPENFALRPGETRSAQLSFQMSTTSCLGIYSNIVIATGGSISHGVVITERLISPTVATIYFWATGACCRPENHNFTLYVNVNIPVGQVVNVFDVRINYTNPGTQLGQGAAQVENLNYSSGLFRQATVLVDCIDGQSQISPAVCPSDDSSAPGQFHIAMSLLGAGIAGPVDGTLFTFTFRVTGNATSIFSFDRAVLVNPASNPSNPGQLDPEQIPVLERMAAFSNQDVVALFNYQPSLPEGSSALRVDQRVIFSDAGSFSAINPYVPIQSFSWNFGDGTTANTTRGLTDHTYRHSGLYTVSLKVADSSGLTGELVREIVVSRALGNLTLTVRDTLENIQAGNVRVSLFNASYQTTPIAVQNTDSSGQASFYNLTPGIYNATMTGQTIVTSSSKETILPGWTTQVRVYVTFSLLPRMNFVGINPSPVVTGTLATLTFNVTSPTTLSGISIDWGDGTATHPSSTPKSDTHTYTTTGNHGSQMFTINVTATNSAGQAFLTVPETVLDQPPVLTINKLSPVRADTGQMVTISFSANDPDGTLSSLTVNWGDGSAPDTLSPTATSDTHSYTGAGSYTINLTATDNSGSTTHVSSSLLVVILPSSPAAQAPTILGLAPTEFYGALATILIIITTGAFLAFRQTRKGPNRTRS